MIRDRLRIYRDCVLSVGAEAPNERFYDARKCFGPKIANTLPKIREWLNNIETAKMPRMPYTTEAMPVAAVHAVQRAADVRTASLEKDEHSPKDTNVKVPSAALYREGVVGRSRSPQRTLL